MADKAVLTPIRIYNFRHSYVFLLINNRVSVTLVEKVFGTYKNRGDTKYIFSYV